MAEGFPGFDGAEGGSDFPSRKRERSPFRPPIKIERSKGYEPQSRHEERLHLQPLHLGERQESRREVSSVSGPEHVTKSEVSVHNSTGMPERVVLQPTKADAEREWRQSTPAELAALAASEAQVNQQLQALEHGRPDANGSDGRVESTKKKKAEAPKLGSGHRHEPAPLPERASGESFEDIMRRTMSPEFKSVASGSEPAYEVASDEPATPQSEPGRPRVEIPAAEVLPVVALAELGKSAPVPRIEGRLEAFDQIGSQADHERSNDDSVFRHMAEQMNGRDPGRTNFHEQTPGQPPIETAGSNANTPPYPPTAEGGAWHGAPTLWELPAGGLGSPATWAGLGLLGALEARHQLGRLRGMAEKGGLAGAVGVLGLGLVWEHMRVNKTRRMLKQQGREHFRELAKTNAALDQERLAHHDTRQRLENVVAAQTATTERLQQTLTPSEVARPVAPAPAAESGELIAQTAELSPAGGLISAGAATELAQRTAEHPELLAAVPIGLRAAKPEAAPPRLSQKSYEQPVHIGERNPEPHRSIETTDVREAPAVPQLVGEAATPAANEAPIIPTTHETRHERLQSKLTDTSSPVVTHSIAPDGSTGTFDSAGLTLPPLTQNDLLAPRLGQQPTELRAQKVTSSKLVVSIAAGVVLVIMAVALIVVFG